MTPELQAFLDGIDGLLIYDFGEGDANGILFQDPRGGPLMMVARKPDGGFRMALSVAGHLSMHAKTPAELAQTYEEMWQVASRVMGPSPGHVPETRGEADAIRLMSRRSIDELHDLLAAIDQMATDAGFATKIFSKRPDERLDLTGMLDAGEDLRMMAIAELQRRRMQ